MKGRRIDGASRTIRNNGRPANCSQSFSGRVAAAGAGVTGRALIAPQRDSCAVGRSIRATAQPPRLRSCSRAIVRRFCGTARDRRLTGRTVRDPKAASLRQRGRHGSSIPRFVKWNDHKYGPRNGEGFRPVGDVGTDERWGKCFYLDQARLEWACESRSSFLQYRCVHRETEPVHGRAVAADLSGSNDERAQG